MRAGRALALAFALAGSVAGAADPASACSMAPRYKVPTNLELTGRAEVIVLATITGERGSTDVWKGVVIATPTVLLKGAALPASVEIKGAYLARDAESRRFVAPSDPRELSQPNPGALIGGCVRYVFAPDMQLLLFLKRDESGALVPFRSSFSRDAEDVAGPDALWVKAVREDVAIGTGSKSGVKARLKARAATLRTLGDADSLAIASDMDIERNGRRLHPYD